VIALESLDQCLSLGHVMRLAAGEDQPHRIAQGVGGQVQLGRQAAPGPAEGLSAAFFRAPAA
jgi:hypothetical protein